MIYFDTDVLVNSFVIQDLKNHSFAKNLYADTTYQETFFVSLLCLQETSFVLNRLSKKHGDIEQILESLLLHNPVSYDTTHFKRAIELASKIGFQHINDCLHTAIAQEYCKELYTFNKADFKRIQEHTALKITIL